HIGMMIYQGDNWPVEYRGRLFTLNLHGRRANQEILERNGSGYVGKHASDFFVAADPWFRGMEISYGPDSGVFVLDWSDTGECHEYNGVHRTSGRIYKITYDSKVGRGVPTAPESPIPNSGAVRTPRPTVDNQLDVTKLSVSELVKLHTHPNEWFSRQARLELTARAETQLGGRASSRAVTELRELFAKESDIVVKLRAFWTLYTIGAADESFLRVQIRHPNVHVRTWAIRFLTDNWPLDTVMSQRPGGKSEEQPRSNSLSPLA